MSLYLLVQFGQCPNSERVSEGQHSRSQSEAACSVPSRVEVPVRAHVVQHSGKRGDVAKTRGTFYGYATDPFAVFMLFIVVQVSCGSFTSPPLWKNGLHGYQSLYCA